MHHVEADIREPLILGNKTYHQITEDVCAPVEGKAGKMWYMVFSLAALLALWGVGCIFYTVGVGIGVWGLNKTDAKEKALRDHEDMFLDSISARELQDFDPNDPEKAIIYNIKTKQYFDRSARLALTVEEEFKKTGRPSRQAQQRGKAKKTYGRKILQNTPEKSVKTHAESHEKRQSSYAPR